MPGMIRNNTQRRHLNQCWTGVNLPMGPLGKNTMFWLKKVLKVLSLDIKWGHDCVERFCPSFFRSRLLKMIFKNFPIYAFEYVLTKSLYGVIFNSHRVSFLTMRYNFAGYESSVKQWCPIPLLGTFSYTHDTGSVTTCGAGSVVSACPDWTELKFDYSQCSTTQVFSGNEQYW